MTGKKIFSIIFILLGLVFLGVIVYFIFFHNFSAPEAVQESKSANTLTKKEPAPAQKTVVNTTLATKKTATNLEEDLKRLALSFAERFGSFSNQSGYQNIKDLKIFMSASMAKWADRYIQDEIAKNVSTSIYYGINTKAVSAKIQNLDVEGGTAKILISTQRAESTGSISNTAKFAQDIVISFVKENGAWKVDSANWQAK